ncbi:MAG: DUF3540 domain-containing protein [Desulfovibrionaceae bacterium]|nr:DUF3540 domain-containing protein [Desulfovibrionaceae bacterium]
MSEFQTIPILHTQDSIIGTGKIQCIHDGVCIIAGDIGMIRAVRSAGCLLEPQKNDLVAVLMTPEKSYVLHVLERQEDTGSVVLPTSTEIRTVRGQTSLSLNHDCITLNAGESLKLTGNSIEARAISSADLSAESVTLSGKRLRQHFGSVLHLCGTMLSQIGLFFANREKSVVRISGSQETYSGSIRMEAEKRLRIRAENADAVTRETFSIDGKKINLG